MIDLHCHLLPGVDDGSFSMEESLRMAAMACDSGVTDIAVTPHCNVPDNPEPLWGPDIPPRLEALQTRLRQEGIPLTVHPGMEIFGTPDAAEKLRQGLLIPLNGTRYPLVEFPFTDYAEEATDLLRQLLRDGWRPLVAHPERYRYLQRSPELANIWTDMGCMLQLNRGSLLGRFGEGAQRAALALLDRGFAACVASDAHRSTVRTPWLADAADLLDDCCGPGTADFLLEENPRRILLGQNIARIEPEWF